MTSTVLASCALIYSWEGFMFNMHCVWNLNGNVNRTSRRQKETFFLIKKMMKQCISTGWGSEVNCWRLKYLIMKKIGQKNGFNTNPVTCLPPILLSIVTDLDTITIISWCSPPRQIPTPTVAVGSCKVLAGLKWGLHKAIFRSDDCTQGIFFLCWKSANMIWFTDQSESYFCLLTTFRRDFKGPHSHMIII